MLSPFLRHYGALFWVSVLLLLSQGLIMSGFSSRLVNAFHGLMILVQLVLYVHTAPTQEEHLLIQTLLNDALGKHQDSQDEECVVVKNVQKQY